MIEKKIGKKIKRLNINNGLEFCLRKFDKFFKDKGIVRGHTIRHMISNAGLRKEFWAKVVSITWYLVNISLLTVIECKTPKEVCFGTSMDYSRLRIFSFLPYAHVN